jgi:ferredoxin
LSLDFVKNNLLGIDYDYFVCGPGPFMESMVAGLESWGVPAEKIHFEAFGPASVKRVSRGPLVPRAEDQRVTAGSARGASGPQDALPEVRFDLSGVTAPWTSKTESLLELAEAHQIPIESGCRAGNCGTCLLAIKSGKVVYSSPPGTPPAPGFCLACICIPDGPLVLQA